MGEDRCGVVRGEFRAGCTDAVECFFDSCVFEDFVEAGGGRVNWRLLTNLLKSIDLQAWCEGVRLVVHSRPSHSTVKNILQLRAEHRYTRAKLKMILDEKLRKVMMKHENESRNTAIEVLNDGRIWHLLQLAQVEE